MNNIELSSSEKAFLENILSKLKDESEDESEKAKNKIWLNNTEEDMRKGQFLINIPEIHIPAYQVRIDLTNNDYAKDRDDVMDNLLAGLCDYIPKPEGELTYEFILKEIQDMMQDICCQIEDAEEAYENLLDR